MNIISGIGGTAPWRSAKNGQTTEEYVCWSRMQAEAGQQLDKIVARKELERQAGEGCFLWGVGNPPSVIANVLARARVPVRAVFSIMKSKPKIIDAAPTRTVAWRRYVDAHGAERPLPPYAFVTSRGDSARGAKRAHYALMCWSDEALALRHGKPFDPTAFRNASGTGAPVGASQVTALLRRVATDSGNSPYEANITAWLSASYWVRLTDPTELDKAQVDAIEQAIEGSVEKWCETVQAIKNGPPANDAAALDRLL